MSHFRKKLLFEIGIAVVAAGAMYTGTVFFRNNVVKATDRIVYSDIAREDIEGKNIDLDTLVDELVMASPESDIVVFFYERALDETEVYVYARENYDVQTMLQQFSPIGTRKQVQFTVSRGRAVAESDVLDVLKSKIKLVNR